MSGSAGPAAAERSVADHAEGDSDAEDTSESEPDGDDEPAEEPATRDSEPDGDTSSDSEVGDTSFLAVTADTSPAKHRGSQEVEEPPSGDTTAAPDPAEAPEDVMLSADLAAPPCGCDEPTSVFDRISVELDRNLTSTAYWLATHPRVPFGPFLEGAVYLVRRTLFPASVGVITSPVTVPLHFTPTTTASGADKLGIYVAIGGSTRPVLFEFDTGSSGLYAAYASAVPENSPWWGDNSTTTTTAASVAFDSGLVYQGFTARAAVSLFASDDSCAALLNSGRVSVGQMNQIGTSTEPDAFWNPRGEPVGGTPPIDGAFYGDFGMSLNYKQDDILNVITQLTYGWGVRPGFRVHVDPVTEQAWVQIGLASRDLRKPGAMYFDMVSDPFAPPKARVPHSRLQYYALQPFDATINLVDRDGKLVIDDAGTPILPDTGASTTIHNTQLSGHPSEKEYEDELVDWKEEYTNGKLIDGLSFFLSGTTTSGKSVTFFSFTTDGSIDGGRVDIQNTGSSGGGATDKYYLNTGISMFDEYDLIYSLGNSRGGGTLGLLPNGIEASERPRRSTTR